MMKGWNLITVMNVREKKCIHLTIQQVVRDLCLNIKTITAGGLEYTEMGQPHLHLLYSAWVDLPLLRTNANLLMYGLNVKYVEPDGLEDTLTYIKKGGRFTMNCSLTVECAGCSERLGQEYLFQERLAEQRRKKRRELFEKAEIKRKMDLAKDKKRTVASQRLRGTIKRRVFGWTNPYPYRPLSASMKEIIKDLHSADGEIKFYSYEKDKDGKLIKKEYQ